MADKAGNQTPNTPGFSESELRELKVDELREQAKQAGVSGVSGMRKEELVHAVAEARSSGAKNREEPQDRKDRGSGEDRGSRKDRRSRKSRPDGEERGHRHDHRGAAGRGGAGAEDVELEEADAEDAEADAEREDAGVDEDAHPEGAGHAGAPGDAGPDGGRKRSGEQTSKSLKYSQEITSPEESPERPGRSLVTTSHEVIRRWAEARDAVPVTVAGTEHGEHLGVLRFRFGPGGSGSGVGRSRGGGSQDALREVSWDEWFATFDERRLNFIYQEERSDGRDSNFFRLESPERQDA